MREVYTVSAVALPLLVVTSYTIVVSWETDLKIKEAETKLEELVANATENAGKRVIYFVNAKLFFVNP